MTTNPYERAVIAAAREVCNQASNLDEWVYPLRRAVVELDTHETARDPEVREVGWHEVAEGDLWRRPGTDKFYEITAVQKLQGGKYRITLDLLAAGKRKVLERPKPDEPTAWVKRGATGAAVDTFVHVFTSGGA